MAKKRKTREQKILADQRHILYHLETSSAQVSNTTEKKIKVELPVILQMPRVQTLNPYAHVIADVKKTALITGAIITAQVILFFVLNRV